MVINFMNQGHILLENYNIKRDVPRSIVPELLSFPFRPQIQQAGK